MRNLITLLLITMAVSQVFGLYDSDSDWTNFKAKHNREYKSPEEEEVRYQIFQKNKKYVEEHNAKYNKGEVSYSVALNHFSDRTPEELAQSRGGIPKSKK